MMSPAKIGRYTLKRKLGQGNTADIYLASDSENGHEIALKVAREGDEQADWIAQLRQEMAILSELSGTAIPKFYGYYEADGYHCVVLEYIEGKNLETVLSEMTAPLDEREAIRWGLTICDVLIRLHRHQPAPLIYRHIGPTNIMLDDQNQLYLIDYGKVLPYVANHDYSRVGEIGYSAPEQYIGKPEPRSDIFCLGVLLYHATTLRDPRKPAGAFLFHVMPPRSINPALSQAFEAVILKAVEHKVVDRYASAEAMKAALLACLRVY
jgi:serine/threonine-protein kinase